VTSQRTASHAVRGAVLDAAAALVSEGELSAFSIRNLAQRAGVAPMSIYNHFDGIGGVLEALWIDGFEKLAAALDVERREPWADLAASAQGYRAFALTNVGTYRLMFLETLDFEVSPEGAQTAALAFDRLVSLVHALPDRRKDWGANADVAQMLWSAVHGFVSLEIVGRNFATNPDVTFANLVAALLAGLR
jgi:AcrR family transcriptional regulator